MKNCLSMLDTQKSKVIRVFFAVGLLGLAFSVFAEVSSKNPTNESECLETDATHQSYTVAIRRTMNSPEVLQWRAAIEQRKNRVSTIQNLNKTVFHDGQCFWEINLYEKFGDHLSRWNAYQVSLSGRLLYRLDMANPDRLISVKLLSKTKTGVFNE